MKWKMLLNFRTTPGKEISLFTTPSEVRDLISKINVQKAPGPDGIPNKAIKHFTKEAIIKLTNIYNAAFRLHHFPKTWKNANVIVLLKPGKNTTFPQNYRPISLLSNLG